MKSSFQFHQNKSRERKKILSLINQEYYLSLTSKKILINDTLFRADGYSENPPVLCEIYAHIGKLKSAQTYKINKDILKLLLIAKMSGKQFRKIIAFANEDAARPFSVSESRYSKLKDTFGIEIITIKISKNLKTTFLTAQKRRYR